MDPVQDKVQEAQLDLVIKVQEKSKQTLLSEHGAINFVVIFIALV